MKAKKVYVKVLRSDLTHNGFTYQLGLNIDDMPFDDNPLCGGGLFFTDLENLSKFLSYGSKVAIVEPVGKKVKVGDNKWKSHKLKILRIMEWAEAIPVLVKLGLRFEFNDLGSILENMDTESKKLFFSKYPEFKGYNWSAKNKHIPFILKAKIKVCIDDFNEPKLDLGILNKLYNAGLLELDSEDIGNEAGQFKPNYALIEWMASKLKAEK